MDLQADARVHRLRLVEIGAATVVVLASVAQGFFLDRFVPVLASFYANAGEPWPLPLRLYVGFCNWALILVPLALVGWMVFQFAGRPLPAGIRRRVLLGMAALAGPVTIAGLYVMAESSLLQAMRLSMAVNVSGQVMDRDLSVAYLASGDPDEVIALLDPKVSREDFVTHVRWGSPGQAFQLAEAYRAKGDMPGARRSYLRAQEAATRFDETLLPHLVNKQLRWQEQFGRGYDFWLPNEADMKKLPDRIRTVSQERLDQLSR